MMMFGMAAALLIGAQASPADMPCDAGPAQEMIATKWGRHGKKRLLKATGARSVRVILPGSLETDDFREDRVTVHVDHERRIADISCG